MGIKDLLSFDEEAYAKKLEAIVASDRINEIREREVLKIRQIWGAGTKIGMGAILALPTMGLAAISSLVGIRQLWIACTKLEAIQTVIKKHNITPHECTLRDAIIPIATNVLTAGIGFGMSVGLSEVACLGAEQAAAQGVIPAPNTEITEKSISAMEDPSLFGQGFMHGVKAQVDGVLAAVFEPGDAAANVAQTKVENAVPFGYCGGSTFINGAALGSTMAASTERFTMQLAITSFLESMAESRARGCLDRVIAEEQRSEGLRYSGEIYEWQLELEQVHCTLHRQYIDLSTVHSALQEASKQEVSTLATADRSKTILGEIKPTDDEARRKRLDVESPPKFRNVSDWFSALEEWSETLKHQAHSQLQWQLIIDEWSATFKTDSDNGTNNEYLKGDGSNATAAPSSPSECGLDECDKVAFVRHHFFKNRDSDINLIKGQFVVILGAKEDKNWWLGYAESGERGLFPRSSVQQLEADTIISIEDNIKELLFRVGKRLASLDGRYFEVLIEQYRVVAHLDRISDTDDKDRKLQTTAELYHRPYENLCRAILQTCVVDTSAPEMSTSALLRLVRSLVNHSFNMATISEDKLTEWTRTISSIQTSAVFLSTPRDVTMERTIINKASSLTHMDQLFMHAKTLVTISSPETEEYVILAPYLLPALRMDGYLSDAASRLASCINAFTGNYTALLAAKSRATELRRNTMTHSAPTAVGFVNALGEVLMKLHAWSISQSALISAMASYSQLFGRVWNLAKELELEAKRKEEAAETAAGAALSSTTLHHSSCRPAPQDTRDQQLPQLPKRQPTTRRRLPPDAEEQQLPQLPQRQPTTPRRLLPDAEEQQLPQLPQRQPTARRRLPPAYEPPPSNLHPQKPSIHQHRENSCKLSKESNTILLVPDADNTLAFQNREKQLSMRVASLKSTHQRLTRQHAALATIKDDDAALEHMEYCIKLKAAAVAAWRSIGGTNPDADAENKCKHWDEALRMWESGIEVWDGEREAVTQSR